MIHLYGVNRLSGNYRVILEMNERLKLGSRKLVANVRTWVSLASPCRLGSDSRYRRRHDAIREQCIQRRNMPVVAGTA